MLPRNCKELFMLFFLLIMTFQDVLTDHFFQVFTYFDEIVTLAILLICLIRRKQFRFSLSEGVFLLLLASYYLVGWYSQFEFGVQEMTVAFKSSLLSVKFFVLFIATSLYAHSQQAKDEWLNILYRVEFPIVIILAFFVFFTNALALDFFMWPWDLCAKSVFFIGITVAKWRNSSRDYLVLVLCTALLLSTDKAKALAAIAIIVLALFWVVKKGKKLRIWHLIFIAIVAGILAWNKIEYYYIIGYERYARSLLSIVGFKIANDFFPFGLGWGSFGSYYSSVEYSKAYYMYGLNFHGELGEHARAFIMDTYWPSVLGETGWLGCSAVLGMVFVMFIFLQKLYYIDKKRYASGVICLLYMLVTTVEESGFAQPVLMCLALLLGVSLSTNRKYSDSKLTKGKL